MVLLPLIHGSQQVRVCATDPVLVLQHPSLQFAEQKHGSLPLGGSPRPDMNKLVPEVPFHCKSCRWNLICQWYLGKSFVSPPSGLKRIEHYSESRLPTFNQALGVCSVDRGLLDSRLRIFLGQKNNSVQKYSNFNQTGCASDFHVMNKIGPTC